MSQLIDCLRRLNSTRAQRRVDENEVFQVLLTAKDIERLEQLERSHAELVELVELFAERGNFYKQLAEKLVDIHDRGGTMPLFEKEDAAESALREFKSG